MGEIRVRFAPSPTGTLHIGGARTALFNWLFARRQQGKFILRLEDTDLERSTENSAVGIVDSLKWLGLDWDEGPDTGGPFGPYRQSERLPVYKQYLQQLLDSGQAYYCFCSAEELSLQREKAQERKENYAYEGTCRDLPAEEIEARLSQGMKPVIRFCAPAEGNTVVQDLVRGEVVFANELLDDFIIAKSDGWPTYNFAVVADDYTMQISHVIRAEEHLPNTPKQLSLYRALGVNPPQFAHVSMILAPDRSKLSKRHGATSVQEFRDQGYLPEALINYLALLGWSPGDDLDLMSVSEMIERFSLDHVSKSAAIYDIEKLTWMNGHYLAKTDTGAILHMLEPALQAAGWPSAGDPVYLSGIIELVRSRVKTVPEIVPAIEYFFCDPVNYDEKGIEKYFRKDGAIDKLQMVISLLETSPFQPEPIETAIRLKAEEKGLKAADLIHPTRLALTGRTNTPGLFEVMALLGADLCRKRLNQAVHFIKTSS